MRIGLSAWGGVALALCLGAGAPARAQGETGAAVSTAPASGVIFADGFETGTGLRWNAVRDDGGAVLYPGADCRGGQRCGQMTIAGGRGQQSIFWSKQFRHEGEDFYLSAWWRFPKGFSWDPAGDPQGLEHKMIVLGTDDGVGRMLVNLRGGGESPALAVHFERVDPYPPGVSRRSEVHWPVDGAWHRLEFELHRVSGPKGRFRLWLDGALALDESGAVCGDPCASLFDVQIGAYSNQGSRRTQHFWVDDVVLAQSRAAALAAGIPTAGPVPIAPALAVSCEQLGDALRTQLGRVRRVLGRIVRALL